MEEGPNSDFTRSKENLRRAVEIATQDPVGNLFIATAVVAAHFDLYPLAGGAFASGIYHITEIDKLQRRKEELLERARDNPSLLQRLDDIHTRLENGDLSDKYTAWLYKGLRERVIGDKQPT